MPFSREQRVGLFFLGGLILFAVFIELTVGTGVFRGEYRLWTEYDDVAGLSEGAQVRVGGVNVGTVSAVELEPGKVRVGLDVREGVPVREDSVARLDFQALSGTRFVAIDLGSPDAAVLEPGSTIPSEEPASISHMVDELQGVARSARSLTDSLNENQERLLREVSELLQENRAALDGTIQNLHGVTGHLEEITEKMDRGEGTLGKLVADERLYEEAIATLAAMKQSFGTINEITGRMARGEGTLGRLLASEDGMYDEIRESVYSLNVTARNFEEISEQIRRGDGTIGRLVADDEFYLETQEAIRGFNRAAQGIEDQAPISVLGTLLGTVF